MDNKLKANDEFWALICDFIRGIRKVEWKYIIGNSLIGYCCGVFSQINNLSDDPVRVFVWSLVGAGLLFIIALGSQLKGVDKKEEDGVSKLGDFYQRLNREKHKIYKENLNNIPFSFIIGLFIWKLLGTLNYLCIDFKHDINYNYR